MMVAWSTRQQFWQLMRSNTMLPTFPMIFIVYGLWWKWFERGLVVWNWILCCIMGAWGSGACAKQTEEALIVRRALMKSATWGRRNEIHARLCIPDIFTQSPLFSFQQCVFRRRGLMSHPAKRMADCLRISRAVMCFLTDQLCRRCLMCWMRLGWDFNMMDEWIEWQI